MWSVTNKGTNDTFVGPNSTGVQLSKGHTQVLKDDFTISIATSDVHFVFRDIPWQDGLQADEPPLPTPTPLHVPTLPSSPLEEPTRKLADDSGKPRMSAANESRSGAASSGSSVPNTLRLIAQVCGTKEWCAVPTVTLPNPPHHFPSHPISSQSVSQAYTTHSREYSAH